MGAERGVGAGSSVDPPLLSSSTVSLDDGCGSKTHRHMAAMIDMI